MKAIESHGDVKQFSKLAAQRKRKEREGLIKALQDCRALHEEAEVASKEMRLHETRQLAGMISRLAAITSEIGIVIQNE